MRQFVQRIRDNLFSKVDPAINKNKIEDVRLLYTELLISILTNTIYEDLQCLLGSCQNLKRPTEQSAWIGPAQRTRWLASRACVIFAIFSKRRSTRVSRSCYRNRCLAWRLLYLDERRPRANKDELRKLYVADSFAGLPPPDPTKYKDPADDPTTPIKNS